MPFLLLASASLAAFGLSGGVGCTPKNQPSPPTPSVEVGKPFYTYDYEQVVRFQILSNPPDAQERWAAEAQLNPKLPGRPAENWRILSAVAPEEPLDRWANGRLFRQLLDNLSTFRPEGKAPTGPLERFGLAQPAFVLKWEMEPDRKFVIELGNPGPEAGTRYARAPLLSKEVFIARGAALKTLEYLARYHDFRRPQILTCEPDDIDEYELFAGTKSIRYAGRQATEWMDRKSRPVADGTRYLEQLTHLRIDRYIDSPDRAQKITSALEAKPGYKLVLTHREGPPTEVRFGLYEGTWFATVSSRPGGVFQILPEVIQHLAPGR